MEVVYNYTRILHSHFCQIEVFGGSLQSRHIFFFKDDNVSISSCGEKIQIIETKRESDDRKIRERGVDVTHGGKIPGVPKSYNTRKTVTSRNYVDSDSLWRWRKCYRIDRWFTASARNQISVNGEQRECRKGIFRYWRRNDREISRRSTDANEFCGRFDADASYVRRFSQVPNDASRVIWRGNKNSEFKRRSNFVYWPSVSV